MTQCNNKKCKSTLLQLHINELINVLGFDINNFALVLCEKDFYNNINKLKGSNIFNQILMCVKELYTTKKCLINLFRTEKLEYIDENERVLLFSKIKYMNDILYVFGLIIKVHFGNNLSFQLQSCVRVDNIVKENVMLCGEREYYYENKMFKLNGLNVDKKEKVKEPEPEEDQDQEPEYEYELDEKEVKNILFIDENKNITYITHNQYIENVKNGRYNSRDRF